jgi:hypothetical protein
MNERKREHVSHEKTHKKVRVNYHKFHLETRHWILYTPAMQGFSQNIVIVLCRVEKGESQKNISNNDY